MGFYQTFRVNVLSITRAILKGKPKVLVCKSSTSHTNTDSFLVTFLLTSSHSSSNSRGFQKNVFQNSVFWKVTFFIIIITVINIAFYWVFLVTITLLNDIIVKSLSLFSVVASIVLHLSYKLS